MRLHIVLFKNFLKKICGIFLVLLKKKKYQESKKSCLENKFTNRNKTTIRMWLPAVYQKLGKQQFSYHPARCQYNLITYYNQQ